MTRRRLLRDLAVIAVLAAIVVVGVVTAPRSEADRVEALGSRLACPVCEGNSLVDSPSSFAQDMLAVIEEQVAAGWSDEQIVAWFQSRFGDDVLLDPPRRGATLVLWLMPIPVVLIGAWALAGRVRRPPTGAAARPSPPHEVATRDATTDATTADGARR